MWSYEGGQRKRRLGALAAVHRYTPQIRALQLPCRRCLCVAPRYWSAGRRPAPPLRGRYEPETSQSAASRRGVCGLCRSCLRQRPSVQQAAVPRTALTPVRSALLSRSAYASSTRYTRSQVRASLHWRHLAPLTVGLSDSSLGFRCRRAPPLLEPLRQWRPLPSRPSRPPCRPARSLRRAPGFAARAPGCAADSPHHRRLSTPASSRPATPGRRWPCFPSWRYAPAASYAPVKPRLRLNALPPSHS